MRRVSVVIGANYGDEGKGVITDALAYRSPDAIVVMSNGGAQRGHTVINPKTGKPHVFKHFGSGTFRGCLTYFPEPYILNPMEFVKEFLELSDISNCIFPIRSVRHRDCLFSTPFDMILNQDIERWRSSRGTPYGTCGMGVWETIVRNKDPRHGYYRTLREFQKTPIELRLKWLKAIRDEYCPKRYRLVTGEEWNPADYVMSEGLLTHFLEDVAFMCNICPVEISEYQTLAAHEGDLIFENGQGLMLDDEYAGTENTLLSTPSRTGMRNVAVVLDDLRTHYNIIPESVDAYYVTRPYLTRHGPGAVLNSKKGEVFFTDSTNGTNEFQGDFRQMPIDHARQIAVIQKDMNKYLSSIKADRKSATLTFTHVDQMSPGKIDFPSIAECGTTNGAEHVIGLRW